MSRRLSIVVLVCCMTSGLYALGLPRYGQGHVISVEGGAGVSGLLYKSEQATVVPFHYTDFAVGVRCSYFFNDWLGLTVGLDASRYGAEAAMSERLTWAGEDQTLLTDDKSYTHILDFHNGGEFSTPSVWAEQQILYELEVPLAVSFRYMPRRVGFIGLAGLKLAVPVHATYMAGGLLCHMGEIAAAGGWVATPENATLHFGTEMVSPTTSQVPQERWDPVNCSATCEAGVSVALHRLVYMGLSLYASIGINDWQRVQGGEKQPLGFATETNQLAERGVMLPYQGLIGTDAIGAVRPYQLGVKLALYFAVRPIHECNCLKY